MADDVGFLRFASPNELRTIAREDAGYYNSVAIGAIYEFEDGFDVKSPRSYFGPLKRCVEEHPFFGVTIVDRHTDKAFYQRAASLNLEEHISIVENAAAATEPLQAIGELLRHEMDLPCFTKIPPWRIIVLPLQASRAFIAFSFSHMIGDGPTGLAFHKTFLAACKPQPDTACASVVAPPAKPLPAPFDTPERLPISWSFLLAPFLAQFIPSYIVNLLGLRISASTVNQGTYLGAPMFFDPNKFHNKLLIREIDARTLQNAIQVSRQHDAKLTATMQKFIVRAMSQVIPDPSVTNFVCQTAVDMRKSIGLSKDVTGLYVSGAYVMHPRAPPALDGRPLSEEEWASTGAATREFARAASTLQDQAIGLLRYVPSVRKWTLGKLGKRRDSSLGTSNLGSFDAEAAAPGDEGRARITKVVFAQPGHALSDPVTFNFVSLRGGSLVYTVTWQPGAMGLGIGEDGEEKVVETICELFEQGFRDLARESAL